MIGNVWAVGTATGLRTPDMTAPGRPAAPGSDISCVGAPGSAFSNMPAWPGAAEASPTGTNGGACFAVNANNEPHEQRADASFRCGRWEVIARVRCARRLQKRHFIDDPFVTHAVRSETTRWRSAPLSGSAGTARGRVPRRSVRRARRS